LRKVEADSVAYLAAAHLGIDTDAITFPYMSSWAGTDPRARPAATVETVTSGVLAAATTVTAYMDAELSPGGTPGRLAVTAAPEPPRAHPPVTNVPPPVPDDDIIQVNMAAHTFFQSRMPASWVPAYLAARGFGIGIQQLWQAGHAPASWDALTRHLRALGFTDTVIEASGLARPSRRGTLIDTFRNRAMLPIRSAAGTVIAFIGRAPNRSGAGAPKYLNSPKTSLYDKSAILFGLWEARDALAAGARPVIVEGPFDAIAVTTAGQGRYAGFAPCGTTLTARHADALSRTADLPTSGVLVAFDPDPAGRRAAVRAYHVLSQLTAETSAVMLPAGQDPAQILTDNSPEALATMLADRTHLLADLVTDAQLEQWARWLDHAEGQISALRAVAPVVADMPPAHVARQVARLSDRLGMDHATVTDAITSALPEVIARRPSPSTATSRPRDGLGRAAQPQARANLPPPGTPARTTAVCSQQAAAQRSPPSLLARQDYAASQDLPASAAAVAKPTSSERPLPGQLSTKRWAPLHRGRVPG
jgi:DNA primase